jgi:periplasmic protein TonB
MRHATAILVLAISTFPVFALPAAGQQKQPAEQPEVKRKLVSQVPPDYPMVAKAMRIEGVVKMEVVIAPNGTAKSVEVKGGHPMLVEAAVDAVHKWKWASAPHETKELVEVKFEQ